MNYMIFLGAMMVLCLAAVMWIRRRKTRSIDDIAGRIKRDAALNNLEEFLHPTCSPAEDAEFYSASGGLEGLRLRRRNAALLVEFFQALVLQKKLGENSVRYIAPVAMSVRVYAIAAYPEAWLRAFVPVLPHVSAKVATSIYADLEAAVRTILQAEYPEGLKLLDAVL